MANQASRQAKAGAGTGRRRFQHVRSGAMLLTWIVRLGRASCQIFKRISGGRAVNLLKDGDFVASVVGRLLLTQFHRPDRNAISREGFPLMMMLARSPSKTACGSRNGLPWEGFVIAMLAKGSSMMVFGSRNVL